MHESPQHGACVPLSRGAFLSLSFYTPQSGVRPALIQGRGARDDGGEQERDF